jgi:hypothetical protein
MRDEEVAAMHEAAHAVFAAFSPWTKLAGPVALGEGASGDVTIGTDVVAISKAMKLIGDFDRGLPRIHLIRALLAGPMVERLLVERGRTDLGEADLLAAGVGDYANVREQMAALSETDDNLLPRLEAEVRHILERPRVWSAIEQFAEILLERRRLEAGEAEAAARRLRGAWWIDVCPVEESAADRRFAAMVLPLFALLAGFAMLVTCT